LFLELKYSISDDEVVPSPKTRVTGLRATLGVTSGAASLEKFSYDQSSLAAGALGSRLRLHVTIDRKFRERLARDRNRNKNGSLSKLYRLGSHPSADDWLSGMTSAGSQDVCDYSYSDSDSDVSHDVSTTSLLNVKVEPSFNSGTSQALHEFDATTPSDLGDLTTSDLLPFPAVDWQMILDDINTDADFLQLSEAIASCGDEIPECVPQPEVQNQPQMFGAVASFDASPFQWQTLVADELQPVLQLSSDVMTYDNDAALLSSYMYEQDATSLLTTQLYDMW
jgi:hypothetical protein